MKRKNKLTKHLTGFTLLEILIVVVIVGILASLAIPRYQITIERARGAEAYTNLGILRGAMLRYWGEYDTLIPDGTGGLSLLDVENPNFSSPNSYFTYGVSAVDPDTGHFVVWACRKENSAYPFHYLVMSLTGAITSPPWPPGQTQLPEGCGNCH